MADVVKFVYKENVFMFRGVSGLFLGNRVRTFAFQAKKAETAERAIDHFC